MTNQIIYPTFKDAQYLYSQYSTIENISILYNNLLQKLDFSFLSTLSHKNIHEIYNDIILKYYPNEICIKSSFINQILLNGKKHVTIFELPIGSSRADLCKINGKSVAYEIKTDLDNFSRLQKQINDYYTIFEEVFVICSCSNVNSIIDLLPAQCGIYSYTISKRGKYHFQLFRNAMPNYEMDSQKQLSLVRKNEFSIFFNIDINEKKRYEIIKEILEQYSSETINRIFKKILKNRFQKQWNFLKQNHDEILEIDYQWFYKNQIEPSIIYNKHAH